MLTWTDFRGTMEQKEPGKERCISMNRLWNKAARFVLSRINKTGLEQELNRVPEAEGITVILEGEAESYAG